MAVPHLKPAALVGALLALSLFVAVPLVKADTVRPTASFTVSPAAPVTGESVTFTSTSSDVQGSIVSQAWDLDNDGSFDDGTGVTANRTFTTAGSYTVRLFVRDDEGDTRTTSKIVTVKANAAPTASFNAPTDVNTGDTVTLTSTSTDPDGRPLLEEWDLDGNGSYGDKTGHQVTTSFADNGLKHVSLRVTDSGGIVRTLTKDINVHDRPPSPSFDMSASDVDTGTPVTFTSTSTDPDCTISSYAWDFNGDGVTDATGASVSHAFAASGKATVKLTVTDDDGVSSSTTHDVTVRNRPPAAAFGFSPAAPLQGDDVTFTSTSSDPDGTLSQQQWDLNGDGVYDDGTGPTAHKAFANPGSYTVGLKVTDDHGATSTAFSTVEVGARPAPPPPVAAIGIPAAPSPPALIAPRLLAPFPLVRIRGVTTRRGARVDLLSVRTPGGTRILVLCGGRGKGCPWRRFVQNARFGPDQTRTMRIPGFRGRRLRAGAVIEIYVTRSGMVGKYTRFIVRKVKPPARRDGCAAAGALFARSCPAR